MYDVPHDGGRLPAYRFGANSKGTAVVFGGFDSYVEEFFPMMLAIAAAGYQVIGSRGAGQGAPSSSASRIARSARWDRHRSPPPRSTRHGQPVPWCRA
jgi:predicted alpha/beta hydrolase